MDSEGFQFLLKFFKVLSDENRLKIIGYLSDAEYRVSDLAEKLDLKEPTVSHHLSRLRELGLVNMRVDGNNRYYRLNAAQLEQMNGYLFQLQSFSPDTIQKEEDEKWIEAMDIPDDDKQVLKSYVFNRRLQQLPRKEKKLLAILRWLVSHFEKDVIYTEAQVNGIIEQYHEDFAGLRRDLVDFGFLARERDGATYWVVR
ncbi:MAG: metalloregulator ArsR/SmtB family transcription factor [Chloroflexi bacterium]|nr:metalloregulator ArsR/SmtB family transcription factor [Chloroflexota bacterium]